MVRTFGVRRKQNAFDEAACHDQLELCSFPAVRIPRDVVEDGYKWQSLCA